MILIAWSPNSSSDQRKIALIISPSFFSSYTPTYVLFTIKISWSLRNLLIIFTFHSRLEKKRLSSDQIVTGHWKFFFTAGIAIYVIELASSSWITIFFLSYPPSFFHCCSFLFPPTVTDECWKKTEENSEPTLLSIISLNQRCAQQQP